MPQSLRLASGGDRPPAQPAFAPRSNEQRRGVKSPASGQDFARITRVNVLVVGVQDKVATFVTSLWPCLVTPIDVRDRGEPLRLPPTSLQGGTIVIYDVDTLTRQEQHALNQWLRAGNGRARVVSSASECLLPKVEAGAFNDELYYRLNVTRIDLTSLVAW